MSSQTDADQDTLFLERVLDQLYDLGSSPKKKSNPQKKKKRKRHDDEEEEDEEEEVPAETSICEDMRAGNAGPDRQKPPKKQPGSNIWPVKQVEVVTFQDPARRPKPQQVPASSKTPASQPTRKKQGDQREELSLEKARLEVHRFGITGYRKEQQRLFEQDRAVMLGARPPKKDFVNYKLLQAQIKGKKQKQKEEVQSGDKKKRKKKQQQSKQKDKKKSSSDPSGAASGQVGRFKNGMLVLSSKEIQKIKKGRK